MPNDLVYSRYLCLSIIWLGHHVTLLIRGFLPSACPAGAKLYKSGRAVHIMGCVSCIGCLVRRHIILPCGRRRQRERALLSFGFVKLLACRKRSMGVNRCCIGAERGGFSIWLYTLGKWSKFRRIRMTWPWLYLMWFLQEVTQSMILAPIC
ncbi:hypothetical protein B0I37DRAFT_124453 [Chaetomium sp. MPI-CAGE-AT-0009]|nr:hypothetical protein B0I37DRAFT_124453 [Chaetomium sp. MPI-CAGE-AT-0009]